MSRSYKKNPYATDHSRNTSKARKRLANQTFRRHISLDENMPARPQHRKYTESWDICDWRNRWTKQEALEWYKCQPEDSYIKRRYPTEKRFISYWEKICRRK